MIATKTKHWYMVLTIGFALLVGGIEKVDAADCDIEDVCKHVEQVKKDKQSNPDDAEPTLDEDSVEKIWKACDSKPPTDALCKFNKVVARCWKKTTEEVVEECKEH